MNAGFVGRFQAAAVQPQPALVRSARSPAAAARAAWWPGCPMRYRRSSPRPRAADRPAARPNRSGCGTLPPRPAGPGRPARSAGGKPLGGGADLGFRAGQQAQRRQPVGQPIGIQIQPQHRLQRRQPRLVQPQRPLHRVGVDAADQISATDDQSGLRPAEQLVAGKASPGRRRRRAIPAASARAAGPSAPGRPGCRCPGPRSAAGRRRGRCRPASAVGDGGGEAGDRVVRLDARASARRSPGRSPTGSRAGGCGWWCRPRAGWRRTRAMMSGMRKAPPISISSPRETGTCLPERQGVQHQQHGGGVVVDHGGGLGAGQLAQQAGRCGRRARRGGRWRGRIPGWWRSAAPRRRPRRLPAAAGRGRDWCAAPCRSG